MCGVQNFPYVPFIEILWKPKLEEVNSWTQGSLVECTWINILAHPAVRCVVWGELCYTCEKAQVNPEQDVSSQCLLVGRDCSAGVVLVQTPSRVWLWPHEHQAVLHHLPESAKLMSIELVIPSNHLFSCHPLLLPPSIFPSMRVFSNESALRIRWPKYWSFSFSISPSNEYSGLISFRMDWFDFLAVQESSPAPQFGDHPSDLSSAAHPKLVSTAICPCPFQVSCSLGQKFITTLFFSGKTPCSSLCQIDYSCGYQFNNNLLETC